MMEVVTMLAVLRSTDVVERPVPLATCLAVQQAVEDSHAARDPLTWHVPGLIRREAQIAFVRCVREPGANLQPVG